MEEVEEVGFVAWCIVFQTKINWRPLYAAGVLTAVVVDVGAVL